MSLEALTEHPQYFISDGDTLLLVENVLFCIHAYFLRRESEIFAQLLINGDLGLTPSHCIPGNELDKQVTIEWYSEERAKATLDRDDKNNRSIKRGFKIAGYTSTALSNLLWMFYNSKYDFTPQGADTTPEMATRRWLSILTSSVLFSMPKLRDIACQSLSALPEPLDPVKKIQLTRVYKLDENWAKDAWMSLCTRENSISLAEAERLGMQDLLKAMGAREKVIQRKAQYATIDETWLAETLSPPPQPTFAPPPLPPTPDAVDDSVKKLSKKKKGKGKK